MKIVIIGAGNVATHVAKALQQVNVQIAQIWSYHYQNAVQLADQVKAVAIHNLNELDQDADFCLIAVKDDAIADIASQLATFKGIVAHTSGAVDLQVLKDLKHYGVFYPLQTFSKAKEISFETIPLCIEAASEHTLASLKVLAQKLSGHVVEIDSEQRKILHLAAVFACNFTNHLYTLAAEVLQEHQLDFSLLRPLISETAAKVQQAMPNQVQTGPAIRNDEQTIYKHQQLLVKQPQLVDIYQILSESIKKSKS